MNVGELFEQGRGWRRSCVYIATTVLVIQREDLIIMVGDDDDVVVNNYGTGWILIDESAL